MKYKKVLVTGGAGFIGSHLVDKLVDLGYKVVVVDDLSGGFIENVNHKAKFYQVDLRQQERIDEVCRKERPEVIFHLASNAAEAKAQFSPIDISSRNLDAFIKTLVAGIRHGMKRIVFTSSIAVYGAEQVPFKESFIPKPKDIYGVSKLACEQSIKILSKVHDFEYVIVRPHNCFGPRQNIKDPFRNVITIFINGLLQGNPYYIYGDGTQQRCFSYIDGVAEALIQCGFKKEAKNKIFNIGSDSAISVNVLSRMLQEISGIQISPIYLPKRPMEVDIAISDHSRAKKYLGYKEGIGLEEGLRRTWEYFKKIGPQEQIYDRLELESKKVPKNWKRK